MAEAEFESASFEVIDGKKQLECPFSKGKLIQKYGKYEAFVTCSNILNASFHLIFKIY